MTKHSDHEPTPISFAELARRAGVNRSSVTRLARSKLLSAALASRLIDAAHPAVDAWAVDLGLAPGQLRDPLALMTGRPRILLEGRPDPTAPSLLSAHAFAARVGVRMHDVVAAVRGGPLARALRADGRIDAEHPAALRFASRRTT